MPLLPSEMIGVCAPFALLFSDRVWLHAQVLVPEALLAPGKCTVIRFPHEDCTCICGSAVRRYGKPVRERRAEVE
jgi:hypothetical protein